MPAVGPVRLILVMAKQPVPGTSKTRLQPAVSPEGAAELSRCFILDALELAAGLSDSVAKLTVRVAGTPASSVTYFEHLAPEAGFVAQRGDNLSRRLHTVMAEAVDEGFDQVVAINSDSPTLPPSRLTDAFVALDRPDVDVVLGPAEDGGYYLIGWKAVNERLIGEVEMSTPDVLADTLALAGQEQLRVELIDPWYDVDLPADLERVKREVAAGGFCGPNTHRLLVGQSLHERPART